MCKLRFLLVFCLALCSVVSLARANNNFSATPPIGGTQISGVSGTLTGSNVGSNGQTGEPGNYGTPIESIWYTWIAPDTGTVTFETCGNPQTTYDTTLQSFVGNAVNALGTPLATNDDTAGCLINGGSALGSRITFNVTSGTAYHIQVDGYNSTEGTFRLVWSLASFTVAKTASIASINAAGPINYNITVDNTGAQALTGLTFTDTLLLGAASRTLTSGPTYSSGDTDADGQIDTTEVWTYLASYTVPQADMNSGGSYSNTINYDTAQTPARTSNTATTLIVQTPALSINKTWSFAIPAHDANSNGLADVGDIITYNYQVSNSGNITINGISVSDVHLGAGSLTAITPASFASLNPGSNTNFTSTYTTVQGDIDSQ
jgi:uncharacterized repeat protein (TIGR01451 family)